MSKYPAQALYGHSLVDGKNGKTVSGAVHRDMFLKSQLFHNLLYSCRQGSVFYEPENTFTALLLIMPNDLKWDIQQFYMIGNFGLVTFGDNPH